MKFSPEELALIEQSGLAAAHDFAFRIFHMSGEIRHFSAADKIAAIEIVAMYVQRMATSITTDIKISGSSWLTGDGKTTLPTISTDTHASGTIA